MHIEAELDLIHAQRLEYLKTQLRKPLPEVLADVIDLALAKFDQTHPAKSSVWEDRARFEQEQGALTEEFDTPPREIVETTGLNPLDQ